MPRRSPPRLICHELRTFRGRSGDTHDEPPSRRNAIAPRRSTSRARELTELAPFEDAASDYDAAVASPPDYAEAYNQRGLMLTEVRRFPEALTSFRKAQQLRPDFVAAHRNELKLHLLTGDFRRAWWKEDQQSKWESSSASNGKPKDRQWDGLQLLSNKTILLHGGRGACRRYPILPLHPASCGARRPRDRRRRTASARTHRRHAGSDAGHIRG